VVSNAYDTGGYLYDTVYGVYEHIMYDHYIDGNLVGSGHTPDSPGGVCAVQNVAYNKFSVTNYNNGLKISRAPVEYSGVYTTAGDTVMGSIILQSNFKNTDKLAGRPFKLKYTLSNESEFEVNDAGYTVTSYLDYVVDNNISGVWQRQLISGVTIPASYGTPFNSDIEVVLVMPVDAVIARLTLELEISIAAGNDYYSSETGNHTYVPNSNIGFPNTYINNISISTYEDSYININNEVFEVYNSTYNYLKFYNNQLSLGVSKLTLGGYRIPRYRGNLTSNPTSDLINGDSYKTTSGQLRIYDGTSWRPYFQYEDNISVVGSGMYLNEVSSLYVDGCKVPRYRGKLASAPTPAIEGDIYKKISDSKIYIYIDGSWTALN